MKKLLPIIFILLFAGNAWTETYVINTGETYETILACVNAVNLEPGDVLDVQYSYTFSGNVAIYSADSGSSGNPIVIKSTNGSTITGPSGTAMFFIASVASFIKFQDLKMVANAGGTTAAISISGEDSSAVEGIEVDNCEFTDFSQGAFKWLAYDASTTTVTSVSITNSTLTRCGDLATGYAAIYLRSEGDAPNATLAGVTTITDNVFVDSPFIDMKIIDEGSLTSYAWTGGLLIQRNTSTGSNSFLQVGGFGASDWGTNNISDNTATGMTTAAGGINIFYSKFVTISGNKFEDSTTNDVDGNGVLVDYGNVGVRVHNNEINRMLGKSGVANSGIAVMVLDSQNVEVYGNWGTGNKSGVYVQDTGNLALSSISVVNNTFKSNVDFGLYIDSGINSTELAKYLFRNNIFTGGGSGTDISDNSTGGGTVDEDYNVWYGFSTTNSAGANNLAVNPRLTSNYIPMNKTVANGGTLGPWLDSTSGLTRYGSGPPIGAKEWSEMQFIPRIGPPFRTAGFGWDYYTILYDLFVSLALTEDLSDSQEELADGTFARASASTYVDPDDGLLKMAHADRPQLFDTPSVPITQDITVEANKSYVGSYGSGGSIAFADNTSTSTQISVDDNGSVYITVTGAGDITATVTGSPSYGFLEEVPSDLALSTELMLNQVDRDFSGASAWTNGDLE